MLGIVLRASTCVGRGGEARRGPLRQAGRSSCLPAPLRLPQRAPSKREPSTQVLCAAYWSLKWMAPVPSTKKKVETMRPMMVVKDSTITTCRGEGCKLRGKVGFRRSELRACVRVGF